MRTADHSLERCVVLLSCAAVLALAARHQGRVVAPGLGKEGASKVSVSQAVRTLRVLNVRANLTHASEQRLPCRLGRSKEGRRRHGQSLHPEQ